MQFNPGATFLMPFLLLDKTTGDEITAGAGAVTVSVAFGADTFTTGAGTVSTLGLGGYTYALGETDHGNEAGCVKVQHPDALPQFFDMQPFPVTQVQNAVSTVEVDNGRTLQGALALMLAALCGKSAGGGTATRTFRDDADTKDRITASIDANNNRTGVSLDDEN